MNTQLLLEREHEQPTTTGATTTHQARYERRASPLDRLALRLGLALLLWSRRTLRRLAAEEVQRRRRLAMELHRDLEQADTTRSLLAPR